MLKVLLLRVGCILVFNNLMVVVSSPGEKYQHLVLTLFFECETQIPWFGYGSVYYPLRLSRVSYQRPIIT